LHRLENGDEKLRRRSMNAWPAEKKTAGLQYVERRQEECSVFVNFPIDV
jgi:hypothetical protein